MRASRSVPTPIVDHLEAALEATCGTLIALESMGTRAGEFAGEISALKANVARATSELRDAISELRSLRGERTSTLAFGFVVESVGGSPRETQPKPRRTA